MRTGMFTVSMFTVFRAFIVLPLCLASLANGSVIYRATDAAGNIIFSDRPMGPDAVAVDIGPINTISAPPSARHDESQVHSGDGAAPGYQWLEISSPKDEATLRDPRKPVPVEVRILPALQPGDRIQLLDNGTVLNGRALDAPDRGLHVLCAQVIDETGKVVIRSPSINVHVHRTTAGRGMGSEKGAQTSSPAMASPGAVAQPAFSH